MDRNKSYDPSAIEPNWYQRWMDAEAFKADPDSPKTPFTIVIPPPNVTGSLHMGHALGNTIQDILSRYKRMDGYEVLWLPGSDHAGIATQMVVERQLAKEGLTRQDLGREKFTERVWQWKEEYGNRIAEQMRRLGSSLDWSRERFTMDEGLSQAVRETFVTLYEQGLIYRDERLVNWDPGTQTVLSDLEVDQEEEDGSLWHIAYPVENSDEKLIVATTRPETLLGDSAVAIHPDDPRYTHLHGKRVALPLTDRLIPIVCDPEAVDMEFGSGAVKITPAHDFNDFETGRRNDLEFIQVIGLDAKINENAPERFQGLDRYEARKAIVSELEAQGLLVKTVPHRFAPGRSQRSGLVVEPLSVGKQWYVKTEPLAKPAIEAVRDGRIEILPETWEKTYFHWMENIRDWCISRQLWWGHRIPAWTCDDCGEITVDRKDPTSCAHCQSTNITQESDVLDTWFSSALWPISTLGWPEDTADLRKFYPTDVMETGFDILFFWVARMIMFGMHFMDGEVPFKTVFLHAMVRDKDGNKMSKTRGNVIDPLHVIDGLQPENLSDDDKETSGLLLKDYPEGLEPQGADALRFTLATYAAAGRDIKLDVHRVETYRQFLNKLWNAARFASMNFEEFTPEPFDADALNLSPPDKWILSRLKETIEAVTDHLDHYRFSDASLTLYTFVWHAFCDWYLELTKPIFYGNEGFPGDIRSTQNVLSYVLDTTLRLMHPIAPFITEELWESLPTASRDADLLALAAWPKASNTPAFEKASTDIERIIGVIGGIRRVRAESNISPGKNLPEVLLVQADPAIRASLEELQGYICRLAKVESLRVVDTDATRPENCGTAMEQEVEIVIPLAGLIDVEAERRRIEAQLEKVDQEIAHVEKKLANPRFVENAKPEVVEADRKKLAIAQEKRATLSEGLARLK